MQLQLKMIRRWPLTQCGMYTRGWPHNMWFAHWWWTVCQSWLNALHHPHHLNCSTDSYFLYALHFSSLIVHLINFSLVQNSKQLFPFFVNSPARTSLGQLIILEDQTNHVKKEPRKEGGHLKTSVTIECFQQHDDFSDNWEKQPNDYSLSLI